LRPVPAGGEGLQGHVQGHGEDRTGQACGQLLGQSAVSPGNGGAEVVVDHVSRSFEDGSIAALVDVSFRAGEGEFVAVTGPSGCGKSTLLNLIGALDRPTSGEITVAGERVGTVDGAEYRASVVGFVFQFHNLIPTLTASENVQLPMLGRGLSRSQR